mgnify:CR=1 FL=1
MRCPLIVTFLFVVGVGLAHAEEVSTVEILEKALANPPATGLLVTGVGPGTPAHQQGVKPGDVLTHYDGKAVATLEVLGEAKAAAEKAGAASVALTVVGGDGTGFVPLEPLLGGPRR